MPYIAPTIPEVPAPAPLPSGATDAQRAQWHETMRLLLQREEYLSQHYDRWHWQQYRDWYQGHMPAVAAATERRHAEWKDVTTASTAAQNARATAEEQVAAAGRANADALRFAAREMRDPPPVVTFPT